MTSASRLRTISETVGVLAVVGSLIFVGLEVRQNAAATRAATAQNLSDGWLQWNLAMSTAEAWAPVYRLFAAEDFEKASPADREAVSSLLRSLFQNWSNLHYHYIRGNLDPVLWEGALGDLKTNVQATNAWRELVLWGWARNRHIYHRHFQVLVDSLASAPGD